MRGIMSRTGRKAFFASIIVVLSYSCSSTNDSPCLNANLLQHAIPQALGLQPYDSVYVVVSIDSISESLLSRSDTYQNSLSKYDQLIQLNIQVTERDECSKSGATYHIIPSLPPERNFSYRHPKVLSVKGIMLDGATTVYTRVNYLCGSECGGEFLFAFDACTDQLNLIEQVRIGAY